MSIKVVKLLLGLDNTTAKYACEILFFSKATQWMWLSFITFFFYFGLKLRNCVFCVSVIMLVFLSYSVLRVFSLLVNNLPPVISLSFLFFFLSDYFSKMVVEPMELDRKAHRLRPIDTHLALYTMLYNNSAKK